MEAVRGMVWIFPGIAQCQCGEGKHTAWARKVKPLLKATENETEFYKKEELEENSNYSFKPIEDVKLRSTEKKIVVYCKKCSWFCSCFSLCCYYAHFSD